MPDPTDGAGTNPAQVRGDFRKGHTGDWIEGFEPAASLLEPPRKPKATPVGRAGEDGECPRRARLEGCTRRATGFARSGHAVL